MAVARVSEPEDQAFGAFERVQLRLELRLGRAETAGGSQGAPSFVGMVCV